MKISEMSVVDVASYLKLYPDELSQEEERELQGFLAAAKQIVLKTTANSLEEADEKDEMSLAVLILCQDMYDNRTRYVSAAEATPNKTLEAILSLNDFNLL